MATSSSLDPTSGPLSLSSYRGEGHALHLQPLPRPVCFIRFLIAISLSFVTSAVLAIGAAMFTAAASRSFL